MINRNMSYSEANGFNFSINELNPNEDDQCVMNFKSLSITYVVPPSKYLNAIYLTI